MKQRYEVLFLAALFLGCSGLMVETEDSDADSQVMSSGTGSGGSDCHTKTASEMGPKCDDEIIAMCIENGENNHDFMACMSESTFNVAVACDGGELILDQISSLSCKQSATALACYEQTCKGNVFCGGGVGTSICEGPPEVLAYQIRGSVGDVARVSSAKWTAKFAELNYIRTHLNMWWANRIYAETGSEDARNAIASGSQSYEDVKADMSMQFWEEAFYSRVLFADMDIITQLPFADQAAAVRAMTNTHANRATLLEYGILQFELSETGMACNVGAQPVNFPQSTCSVEEGKPAYTSECPINHGVHHTRKVSGYLQVNGTIVPGCEQICAMDPQCQGFHFYQKPGEVELEGHDCEECGECTLFGSMPQEGGSSWYKSAGSGTSNDICGRRKALPDLPDVNTMFLPNGIDSVAAWKTVLKGKGYSPIEVNAFVDRLSDAADKKQASLDASTAKVTSRGDNVTDALSSAGATQQSKMATQTSDKIANAAQMRDKFLGSIVDQTIDNIEAAKSNRATKRASKKLARSKTYAAKMRASRQDSRSIRASEKAKAISAKYAALDEKLTVYLSGTPYRTEDNSEDLAQFQTFQETRSTSALAKAEEIRKAAELIAGEHKGKVWHSFNVNAGNAGIMDYAQQFMGKRAKGFSFFAGTFMSGAGAVDFVPLMADPLASVALRIPNAMDGGLVTKKVVDIEMRETETSVEGSLILATGAGGIERLNVVAGCSNCAVGAYYVCSVASGQTVDDSEFDYRKAVRRAVGHASTSDFANAPSDGCKSGADGAWTTWIHSSAYQIAVSQSGSTSLLEDKAGVVDHAFLFGVSTPFHQTYTLGSGDKFKLSFVDQGKGSLEVDGILMDMFVQARSDFAVSVKHKWLSDPGQGDLDGFLHVDIYVLYHNGENAGYYNRLSFVGGCATCAANTLYMCINHQEAVADVVALRTMKEASSTNYEAPSLRGCSETDSAWRVLRPSLKPSGEMAEQSLYYGSPSPKRFYGSFSSTAGSLFIQHGVSVETASNVFELKKTEDYPILETSSGGFGVTYKTYSGGLEHLLRFEAGCIVDGSKIAEESCDPNIVYYCSGLSEDGTCSQSVLKLSAA